SPCTPKSPYGSSRRAAGLLWSRTTKADSLLATCEPRQALRPTPISASTTASLLSPSTLWRGARRSSQAQNTSRGSRPNQVGKRSTPAVRAETGKAEWSPSLLGAGSTFTKTRASIRTNGAKGHGQRNCNKKDGHERVQGGSPARLVPRLRRFRR